jgi:hypothetical protein
VRIFLALLLLFSTLAATCPAPASTMENCGCAMPEGRCCCAADPGPVTGPAFDACPCVGPAPAAAETQAPALLPVDTTHTSWDAQASRASDHGATAEALLSRVALSVEGGSPLAVTSQATLCTWRR